MSNIQSHINAMTVGHQTKIALETIFDSFLEIQDVDIDVQATSPLMLEDLSFGAGTTPISLAGDFTTGISIAADGTTGIEITSAFSGTTGISLAGEAVTQIAITGDGTTGIQISSGFTGTEMISLEGTATRGINIEGACTSAQLYIGGTAILASGEQSIYVNCPLETTDTNLGWFTLGSTVTSGDLGGLRVHVTANAASTGPNIRAGRFEAIVGASKFATLATGVTSEVDVSAGSCTATTIECLVVQYSAGASLTATNFAGIKLNLQGVDDESFGGYDAGIYMVNEANAGQGRTIADGILIAEAANHLAATAYTDGIHISAVCTTGINLDGAMADGIIISGTTTDNGIEITGVAQGAGILIDYTIPTITSYALHIDCNTDVSADDVECVVLELTNTVAGINNLRLIDATLTLGAQAAGPQVAKFMLDCTDKQVTGTGAALGLEINLIGAPAGSGYFHCVTMDFECPTSYTGSQFVSFEKFEIWGETAPKAAFNAGAFLFYTNGLTALADNLLSATSQTLKVNVEGDTRYLVLSQMQNGLGLGNTTTGMPLTSTTTLAIDVYTTTAVTTDTDLTGMYLEYTRTASTAADGRDRGIWVRMEAGNYRWNTMSGVYSTIEIGSGGCLGRASAIQGELILDNTATSSGAYSAIDAEITYSGSNSDGLPGPVSYISMIFSGTETNFVSNAYLFEIDGGTAGAGDLISANVQTAKCIIGEYGSGVERFLLFSQAEDSLSLTTTATPIVLVSGGTMATGIGITGTLATATSRAINSAVTVDSPGHGDGYAVHEFTLSHNSGTNTQSYSCLGAWINITGGVVLNTGGLKTSALNTGIYVHTATVTGSQLIFGLRMTAELLSLTGSPDRLCPFSLNTGDTTITALFDCGSMTDEIGFIPGVSSMGTQSGSIPFAVNVGGIIHYIQLFDAAAS